MDNRRRFCCLLLSLGCLAACAGGEGRPGQNDAGSVVPRFDAGSAPADGGVPSDGGSSGLDWYPGNYVKLLSGSASERDAFLASSVSAPFVGIEVLYGWAESEASPGDYAAGFSSMDADLAAAASAGKKVLLYLTYKAFTAAGGGDAVPAYLRAPLATGTAPWCVTSLTSHEVVCGQYEMANGRTAMIWVPGVQARYRAWIAAAGEHFGPAHPHASALAGLMFSETALSAGAIPLDELGFTQDAYLAGIEDYLSAAVAAFPSKPAFAIINFFPPNNSAVQYLTQLAEWALLHPHVGLGCPDVSANISPPGYEILRSPRYQHGLHFNVEVESPDYRADRTTGIAQTWKLATAAAPDGFNGAMVTWANVRNLSGNVFDLADVSAFLSSGVP